MNLFMMWNLTVRFVSAWNRDRWELVVLSIPLTRAALYVVQLAPPQLNDEVIGPPWQAIMLCLLGSAALTGMVGVLRERPIVERTGLHILGPLGLLYGLGSIASDWKRGTVLFIVYAMITACCAARAMEITRSMRIVNQRLTSPTVAEVVAGTDDRDGQ